MLLLNNVPLSKEQEKKLFEKFSERKPKKGDKPWEFRTVNYGLKVTADPDEKRVIASGTESVPNVCMIVDPLETTTLGLVEFKYVHGQAAFDKDKQPIEKVTEILFKDGKLFVQPHEVDKYIFLKVSDYNSQKEGRNSERAALYYEYSEAKTVKTSANKILAQAEIINKLAAMSKADKERLAISLGYDTSDPDLMNDQLVLYAVNHPVSFGSAVIDPLTKFKSLIQQAHGADVLTFIEETTSWGYTSESGVEPIFRVPQGEERVQSFAVYLSEQKEITLAINKLLKEKEKS